MVMLKPVPPCLLARSLPVALMINSSLAHAVRLEWHGRVRSPQAAHDMATLATLAFRRLNRH